MVNPTAAGHSQSLIDETRKIKKKKKKIINH